MKISCYTEKNMLPEPTTYVLRKKYEGEKNCVAKRNNHQYAFRTWGPVQPVSKAMVSSYLNSMRIQCFYINPTAFCLTTHSACRQVDLLGIKL